MITKVTTFNLFLPSRVYFFDSSTCFYFNYPFDIATLKGEHIVPLICTIQIPHIQIHSLLQNICVR